jgi:fused signal recognition particle receptor
MQEKGFFGKLGQRLSDAILFRPQLDDETLEELEEIMITSDIGMDTTTKIVESLRDSVRLERLETPEMIKNGIIEIIAGIVDKGERQALNEASPVVILMVGVNGGGKTTTIAKLAKLYKDRGNKVLLAAADTFRAAASEQLDIWAGRIGVDIVKHKEGADPSAVLYDALEAGKARGADIIICDTAGRLQTKTNLMNELSKMHSVIKKGYSDASVETLLVLDATTGKNAISQAESFNEATEITGIVLTKMDGTAKGGIAITITDEYDIPIKLIGVGEKADDLVIFNPKEFARSIFL